MESGEMNTEILGVALQIVLLIVISYPLGKYIAKVYKGEKTWSDFMKPVERLIYKVAGVNPEEEMNWKQFLKALLILNAFWFVWGMVLLCTQQWLPLNPDGNANQTPDLAFNTCISFMVNCNLQHYSGESGLTYFTQLFVIMLFQFITAATGMDALTHAIEAYVSVDANPVTDAAAIQSIKLIANNLRQAVANGSNVKARENMAYASYLAGLAFNNGNLGYVHAMAHQLGGQYDMAHGVANAMLLPTVEEYNLISNPEKFRDIAIFMGKKVEGLSLMDAAHAAVDAMRELAEDVGIPSGLAQMGVKEEDFDLMATNALKDGNAFSNPRKGNKQDIIDLFRKAM